MEKFRFEVLQLYQLMIIIFNLNLISSQGQLQLRYQLNEEQDTGYYIANIKYDSDLAERYNRTVLNQLKFQFLIQPEISVTLNSVSGILETSGRIDRDTLCPEQEICEVILDIAIHPVQYFQIFKVILEILDNNDVAPRFSIGTFHHNILESASVGSSILLPSARDTDSPIFGVSSYRLERAHHTFELNYVEKIDGTTEIKLILTQQLDRESVDIYNLRVIAKDGGSPPKEGFLNIVISVLDSNDNRPVFQNSTYVVNIQENLNKGTTILRVQAIDSDEGLNGDVFYKFSSYTEEMYGNMFNIQKTSGHIIVTGVLDYETVPNHKYTLLVTASDRGSNPVQAEATVIVNLIDQNDCIPQIGVNTLTATNTDIAYVSENVVNDTFVAHITVKDDDSLQNGQVDCILDSNNFKLVQMYEKEYKIVTKGNLDRETGPKYNVVLVCNDRGIPEQRSMKHLVIGVQDRNDNEPVFDYGVYNVTIEENKFANMTVCTVTATDRDLGENGAVVYSIPEKVMSLVSINPNSGVVKTLTPFDRERTPQIQFEVTAKDRGSPPQSSSSTVIINIKDVNDEAPKFTQESYSFSIMEKESPGTEVGMVQAYDKDEYPNNQCKYSIITANESWKFEIDSDDGTITSKFTLDREESHVYYVKVKAIDKMNSFLSSTTQVVVHVGDLNDNAPYIVFPKGSNSTVSISNKLPVGYLVAKVIATDLDLGKNAKLSYEITSGNQMKLFSLQRFSGYLTSERSLNFIRYEEFILDLKISDEGEPPFSTTTSMKIIVDNTIPFTMPIEEKKILGNSKLVIIISLAIASSFLTVILIIAIICMKRLERRRTKIKKHQARMEGLKMLSANNMNLTDISTAMPKTVLPDSNGNDTDKKVSCVVGSVRMQSPPENSDTVDLWKSPKAREKKISDTHNWHGSYAPSQTKIPSRERAEHERDLSADGSHTTDSGRGASDVGEQQQNAKPDILHSVRNNNVPPKSTYQGYSPAQQQPNYRSATILRTFNPSAVSSSANIDSNAQIGHSHRHTTGTLPSQGQRQAAVVHYGNDSYQKQNSPYLRDPVRSRTYYRDTPMYTNQKQQERQSPDFRDRNRYEIDKSKLLDTNNSTFV